MAHGERIGPEGLSRHSEDVGVQTAIIGYSGSVDSQNSNHSNEELLNNIYINMESRDEFIDNSNYPQQNVSMEDIYRSLSQVSLNDNYEHPQYNGNIPIPSHDVPVCLHEGTQGGSPVLITLPFQTMDNLQTFVPCSTCHQPNVTSPSIRASNTVAFCVSEVNIRTSQLTLVPCFLCWKPAYQSAEAVPSKITVPLFPTLSTNSDESGASEESIHFVPCGVCLQLDHEILEYPPLSEVSQPHSQETVQPGNIENLISDNNYHNTEHSLTSSRSYFRPLRVSGTNTESVREFTTQTSPNLGIMESEEQERDSEGNEDIAVAWFIPFSSSMKNSNELSIQPLSLQRAFLKNCTTLIKKSKQRQRDVPKLAKERKDKSSNSAPHKRSKVEKTETATKMYHNFGSYPTFTHKEMRQQTEKVYRRLPEAYEPQRQKLREQLNQTHRLMAYLFQKKLQRATLRGKVSWEITESCL